MKAMLALMLCAAALGCGQAAVSANSDALAIAAARPLSGETPAAADADWPWWRGPAGAGVSRDAAAVPAAWSTTENVRWKAAIPGRGHATPSIWGDQIFIATADEDAHEQRLLAFDRQTGRELWNTLIHADGFMKIHGKNSYASATPACDGQRVYAAFINGGKQWLTAVDLDGKIAWQKEVGPFNSEHGDGPSPVLYKSTVIINGDGLGASYIAALDRQSGDIVWRTPREGQGRHANYGAPIIGQIAGKPQLVLVGHGRVVSYNPDTGQELWTCRGPAEVGGNTPAFSDEMVFASAGFPEHELLAIRADGAGDVSKSHVAWRTGKATAYVPSPLYHDGRLYVVSDQGVATCYDAASGMELWQERLGGGFSASPTLAGDLLFATNEAGATFVFKTGDKYVQVAKNDLGSGGMASPVICGGCIYLRTADSLYAIAK